eukprot:SAG11_NODE_2984_length_2791_cov_1.161961_1_plen_82_part_00
MGNRHALSLTGFVPKPWVVLRSTWCAVITPRQTSGKTTSNQQWVICLLVLIFVVYGANIVLPWVAFISGSIIMVIPFCIDE